MINQARSGHLLRRDATTARLVEGGATAPEPAAAYQVSVAVRDAATALQLAQDIENRRRRSMAGRHRLHR